MNQPAWIFQFREFICQIKSIKKNGIDRRNFLSSVALSAPAIVIASSAKGDTDSKEISGKSKRKVSKEKIQELKSDLVIIGGGLGGCAAALAALRNGISVIMTEETDWIGGQMTQQAVPPDEHPWIETFGTTQTYRELRSNIRSYYKQNYPLTEEAMSREFLNPGDGRVSKISHEPRVSLAVLESMLAPYRSAKQLTLLTENKAVSADTAGDKVKSIKVISLKNWK